MKIDFDNPNLNYQDPEVIDRVKTMNAAILRGIADDLESESFDLESEDFARLKISLSTTSWMLGRITPASVCGALQGGVWRGKK